MTMRILTLFLFLLSTAQANSVTPLYPEFHGVTLEDLADEKGGVPELRDIAQQASAYVAAQKDLAFANTISVIYHSLAPVRMNGPDVDTLILTVDILGRDKRFVRINSTDKKQGGGLGFQRVQLELKKNPENKFSLTHKILMQRDYSELSPHAYVSLYDRLVTVEDDATQFRRTMVLDVGSLDTVRYRNVKTIMTPVTELAVLDKNHIERKRGSKNDNNPDYPYNFKPFLRLRVPTEDQKGAKGVRYRSTAIAFHTYMKPPGFRRAFISHGCMRMRDNDLFVMRDFIEGVRDNSVLPVKVRIELHSDARHPFPHEDELVSRVKNFGTKENPKAKKIKEHGTMLTKTEDVKKYVKKKKAFVLNPEFELPAASEITGISMDPAVGPMPIDAEEEF